MKLQLIMLNTPIIVSDEEIKEGSKYLDELFQISIAFKNRAGFYKDSKKIIAGLPELPSIDFNEFEEQLGIVDVEKLIPTKYCIPHKHYISEDDKICYGAGFIDGFQAAQKLNEKKFSLEDMANLWQFIVDGAKQLMLSGITEVSSFEDYIKSLQQPKVFNIEVEMEAVRMECNESRCIIPCACYHQGKPTLCESGNTIWEPKITNNRIKITKICGV